MRSTDLPGGSDVRNVAAERAFRRTRLTVTQRLVDGRPAPFSGETVQIGALDSYEARCRACYEPGADAVGARAATA